MIMKPFNFDIDIDCSDRSLVTALFDCTPASVEKHGEYTKHNTGVYFQTLPVDPLNGYSAIDHKQADNEGYLKIDFLNNRVYQEISSPAHLEQLLSTEPMWELLEYSEISQQLYHVNNYSEVLQKYKPRSIEQLAMLLAIIRPAKKHLLGKSYAEIEATVWEKPTSDEYFFKKAHAIAFSTAIVVQLNLLCEKVS